jgi:hypothetical protein
MIGCSLLLLATLCVLGCSVSADLDDNERALLLTEADFKASVPQLQSGVTGKFSKQNSYLERKVELSYKLEANGFYLTNSVTIEPSTTNALITHTAQRAGLIIGLKSNGVVEEPLKLGASYGDKATLSVLKRSGKPIGNVFTTVVDRKVYLLVFSGIHFDSAEAFGPLIAPKMDTLTKYEAR